MDAHVFEAEIVFHKGFYRCSERDYSYVGTAFGIFEDLRFLSGQYSQRISTLTAAKVQLLVLLNETILRILSFA